MATFLLCVVFVVSLDAFLREHTRQVCGYAPGRTFSVRSEKSHGKDRQITLADDLLLYYWPLVMERCAGIDVPSVRGQWYPAYDREGWLTWRDVQETREFVRLYTKLRS